MLLGHSGAEVYQNEFLDSDLCEMVMLIKRDNVSVYLDATGYNKLRDYLLCLPNVEIFTPNQLEEDNKDECELIKIAQFQRMMRGISTVGVLLGKKDKESVKNVEKWPIVQSYGLLGKGFFSMTHKPLDLTSRINQLYATHDRHSLKTLIYKISNRLTGHV